MARRGGLRRINVQTTSFRPQRLPTPGHLPYPRPPMSVTTVDQETAELILELLPQFKLWQIEEYVMREFLTPAKASVSV